MTILGIFTDLTGFSILSRSVIVFLVCGLMPFTAMSFFWVMMPKREKDFSKSLREMGINSSRTVRDTYSPSRYLLPVGFVTVLCILFMTFLIFADNLAGGINDSLLLTSSFFGDANKALINQSLSVLTFAFMGSYLWSAQNIIRRLINADLSPNVYYKTGVRILLSAVIALILSFLIGEGSGTNVLNFKASLPAIAFLTGMFPERILNYLMKIFKKYVEGGNLTERQLSLYNIEGISMSHKERLNEIGIDDAQNLATASLTKLLVETPFSTRQLLDWIGQAKLLCYVKDDIHRLRAVGIRSVFDFYRGEKSEDTLQMLSAASEVNPALMQVVSNQVRDDEGIKSLFRFEHRINSPEFDNLEPTS